MGVFSPQPPKVVRTTVGRAIHSPHTRLPVVPHANNGTNAANLPKVNAFSIGNPFQRLKPR
jgi:hypothetical protein